MKKSIQVCVCALVAAFSALACAAELSPSETSQEPAALSDEALGKIREEFSVPLKQKSVERWYDESDAEQFAEEFGQAATPELLRLLARENTPPEVKAKLCFYLGKLKDSRATQPMIDLFEKATGKDELPEAEFDMALFVLTGLGFSGRDEAREFLASVGQASYWTSHKAGPTVPGIALERSAAVRLLRSSAFLGLSQLKSQAALVDLRTLRSSALEVMSSENYAELEGTLLKSLEPAKADQSETTETDCTL